MVKLFYRLFPERVKATRDAEAVVLEGEAAERLISRGLPEAAEPDICPSCDEEIADGDMDAETGMCLTCKAKGANI